MTNNIEAALLIISTLLILYAIAHDFLARTIPDELNFGILIVGAIYAFTTSHPWANIHCTAIWFVAFLFIGLFGLIGMGDVKLIPGVLLCISPNIHVQIDLIILIGLFGGLLSLYYIAAYKIIKRLKIKPKYKSGTHGLFSRWRSIELFRMSKKAGIPYGFAIGVGGIITMWLFR